ncbi:MAG: hypothetical protein AAFV19_07160 [Pseudomonadota bacterium]
MHRLLIVTLAAAIAVTAASEADAGKRKGRGGETTAEDQFKTVQAEWKRARSLGGYPDPYSAVVGLLNGTLPEGAIQQGLNDPQAPEVQNPDQFFR